MTLTDSPPSTKTSGWRVLAVFLVSFFLILLTRLPLIPFHLFSFDSVNLALALTEFDPTRHQPQPPGYPLFVAEARLVNRFFGSAERTFAALAVLAGALSVTALYLVGRRMFSPGVGLTASALLFVNPVFWYSGLTSPLRPHLAVVSAAAAYFSWRALCGEGRYFYAASVTIALGAGFRPDLALFVLPLWAWTAWQLRQPRLAFRAALLAALTSTIWLAGLVMASGGVSPMIASFKDYILAQTHQTSLVLDAPLMSWRRMVGRAIIWTGLGALSWFWALPWLWRTGLSQWRRQLVFLAVWFFPPFLFHVTVHIGDPDHALVTIPVLCLAGALCLVAAEQSFARRWTEPVQQGFLIWLALAANVVLFFGHLPLPQRTTPVAHFRGPASLADALRFGTYETSYQRVQWVEQMTDLGLKRIAQLQSETDRPVALIWLSQGVPVWRKVSFYAPSEQLYVLDEQGDPGVAAPLARVWTGNKVVAEHSGKIPIQLPIPKGVRLIWFIAPATVEKLRKVVPLESAPPLYFTDLTEEFAGFRLGSFEFVPVSTQR